MLLYLPERIYNNVFKDDKTYADMVSKATEEIFTNDFVKSMIEYENDNILIKNLQKYIIEKSPEEYQMELKLSFNDDLEKYESQFKQMDTETKLYWLCEVNGGNQVDTKEFDERNKKFKFYYEQFVLPEPEKYSNFFHMMYYAKLIYDRILDLSRSDKTLANLKDFMIFEEKVYNECASRAEDERFYQMMYSKREQMFTMMFEFFGQFIDELDEVVRMVDEQLYNGKFKYNDFTYFRTIFNLLSFQTLIDKNDLKNAKKCWVKLTNMINFAFENKGYANKSLNHYNNSFLDEFLGLVKYVYYIDKNYMKDNYLTIDANLVDMEIDFFEDKIDKDFLTKYINDDPSYSYDWLKNKKVILGLI